MIQCKKDEPEPEPEPPKEFKIVDGFLINALAANGFDKNNDRIIDSDEALAIEYLYIDECNISNMEGIQNFVNLKRLDCRYNNLTGLDVSYNSKLEKLYCNENQLTKLKLNGDSALVMYLIPRLHLNTWNVKITS